MREDEKLQNTARNFKDFTVCNSVLCKTSQKNTTGCRNVGYFQLI